MRPDDPTDVGEEGEVKGVGLPSHSYMVADLEDTVINPSLAKAGACQARVNMAGGPCLQREPDA